jgi:hypothetical protein
MTEQDDFLKRLIDALNDAEVSYMLSGSMCSSFHGKPRATNDVDIVIAPTETQLERFVQSLGNDYYVSLDAVRDAFKCNSMFNVIDIQSGWKADFVICKKRPFSSEEFQRRRKVNITGLDIWVVSPEDMILTKLEWSRGEVSGNQFQDALGVAVVQADVLDKDYLLKWAKELQVDSLLEQLLDKAKKLADSNIGNQI